MSTGIPFRKMNGLGNEIVVVDLRGSRRVLDAGEARAIAARPASRFDQMMVLHDAKVAGTEAYVRIYNADGSEAEACGNGMRCVGWLAAERDRAQGPEVRDQGRRARRRRWHGIDRITVDMGTPRFGWRDIPLAEPFHDTRAIELQIGPIDKPILHSPSVVNVGNPHAVFWVEDVDAYDLGRIGPMLENHPIFPERANISLAHVTSPHRHHAAHLGARRRPHQGLRQRRLRGDRVRGAQEAAPSARVTVTLPGGPLGIEWRADDHICMTGPVELEHEGVLDALAAA